MAYEYAAVKMRSEEAEKQNERGDEVSGARTSTASKDQPFGNRTIVIIMQGTCKVGNDRTCSSYPAPRMQKGV